MSDLFITCKVHDNQQRVIKVGINGVVYDKDVVWNWIMSGTHNVFVSVGGRTVRVFAKTSPEGFKYLTTSPDGYAPNNLDELPDC